MKNVFYLLCLSVLLLFTECKERGSNVVHTIPPKGSLVLDSQYTGSGLSATFDKTSLIEEFSGVECVNCPSAASIVEGEDTTNNGKVISITMHSYLDGALSDSLDLLDPTSGTFLIASKSSYRNTASDVLRNLLGSSTEGQLPQIALNRNLFTGTDIVFGQPTLLSGYLPSELSKSSPARITFISTNNYDPSSRTVTVSLKVEYGSSVSEDDYLSVALKEDKIRDWQKKASSSGIPIYDSNYIHNNVLREYIYPENGLRLPSATAGQTYIISFNTVLPVNWNPDNMEIVAILHKQNSATSNFYISQVSQIPVK